MNQSKNSLKTFYKILSNLPVKRKKQFGIIFASMVFYAGFETITLAFIALYASTISDPNSMVHSSLMLTIQNILQVEFLKNIPRLIIVLSVIIIILVITKNVLLSMLMYIITRFSFLIKRHFGRQLLGGFLNLPYEWHLSRNSADLVIAIQWAEFFGTFSFSMLQLICDTLVISIMLAAILTIEPLLTLILILALGSISVFIYLNLRRTLDKVAVRVVGYETEINRHITKSMHGIKDVKIFRRESGFVKYYADEFYILSRLAAKQQVLSNLPHYILESLGFVGIASTICVMILILGSSEGKIMGTVALIVVATWRILPALKRCLGGISNMRKYLPYVWKGFGYLDEIFKSTRSERVLQMVGVEKKIFDKEIQLRNACFSYNGIQAKALHDINLRIKKGQTLGIIGSSGAGKSTLIDALIGLFPLSQGEILIDGKCLDGKLFRKWIKIIGYVPQVPYMLDGTLAQNVAFGLNDCDINREKVFDCCRMAAMEFLDELPAGIDTLVGERGVKLSGGQRQRIAIARALYKRPEVIIFDEATSSLDDKSEKEIQNTIYSFKGKKTLIIVAHRLSTVEECDLIIWIDKGKIKKIGKPVDIFSEYRK